MRSEIKDRTSHIMEYARMNVGDKENLQKEIAQSQGIIRVFVHPFYDRFNTSEAIASEHLTKAERVHKGVEKVLLAKNEAGDNPPIFFMEESDNRKKLETILRSLQVSEKTSVVLVETLEGVPTPKVFERKETLKFFPDLQRLTEKSWIVFIKNLKDLGVKKAIIGGSFFWTGQEEINSQGYPPGCVGAAIHEFASNGIEVVISNFNNPDAREEAKNNPWLNKFTKNV